MQAYLILELEIVRTLNGNPALQVELLDYLLSNLEASISEELKLIYIELLCRQFPKKVTSAHLRFPLGAS
jgi:hypothetical protein